MSDCPFCNEANLKIVLQNEAAVAVYDLYPQSKGHMLVILKRHVPTYFEATPQELQQMNDLLFEAKSLLDKEFNPDGYNVVSNVGKVAGQMVPHLHIHLIPRYV